MSELNSLKSLCAPDKLVRSNFYSDTYRSTIVFDNVESEFDVQHIRIPFEERKERELRARFGMDDNALKEFYQAFFAEIKTHFTASKRLSDMANPRIDDGTYYYVRRLSGKGENDIVDVFFLHQPADPLVGSELITNEAATKENVLRLGVRLLQTIKNYNDLGLSLGTVDLDSIVMELKGDKAFLKNDFFYTSSWTGEGFSAPASAFTTHMEPHVAAGDAAPSFDGDIYAACSLLWALLSGKHWSNAPDITKAPAYCSRELADLLLEGMRSGAAVYKDLNKALRNEASAESEADKKILIRFEKPAYADELAAIASDYQPVEEPEKPARKKKGVLFPILLLILAIAGSIYAFKELGLLGRPEESSISEVESSEISEEILEELSEEESETSEESDEESVTPAVTSDDMRLYIYDGRVVNYYGVPTGKYFLDEEGNIAFTPQSLPTSLADMQPRENAIPLIAVSAIPKYTPGENTYTLSNGVIEAYGITEGTVLVPPGADPQHPVRVVGLTPGSKETVLSLEPACISDLYENMDDDLYEMLVLVTREDEVDRIQQRITTSGGITSYLYYDETGAIRTQAEWDAQEALRAKIEAAKATLEEYRTTEGTEIVVPAAGTEEYVFIERIYFAKEDYTITMNETAWGTPKETMFVVSTGIEPANATCQEVLMAFLPFGITIPYNYNAPYLIDKFGAYDDVNAASFDYARGENGALTIVLNGENLGIYTLYASAAAGSASTQVTIKMTDEEGHTEDIPEVIEEPSKTESSGKTESESSSFINHGPSEEVSRHESSTSERESSHNESRNSSKTEKESSTEPESETSRDEESEDTEESESSAPLVESAEESEASESQAESKADPHYEDEEFTVSPASVTLHVGESINLSPSDSCRWSTSDASVAVMGGSAGRTLTAKGAGTCTITARSGDQTFTVSVTVLP